MKIKLKTNQGYQTIDTPTFEMGVCKYPECRKIIFWIRTKNGKSMPVSRLRNGDLVPHWFDCPGAKKFRKKNETNNVRPVLRQRHPAASN